jgi:hypothetical protein
MLIRKQVLAVTGGFDERYFMYGEDIDLSYQVNNTPIAGSTRFWKTWYFAGSSIIHFKGESTQKQSLRYVQTFYRAMLLFVKKHYPAWRAIIFSGFIYLAMVWRALATLLIKRPEPAPAAGPAWVVGTKSDFEEVTSICSGPGNGREIRGLIEVDNDPSATGTALTQWHRKHQDVTGATLIFCPGQYLKMADVLKYLQPENKSNYLFHYSGSKSIVGSASSNRSGEVITGE